jgi:hypothetical protein
MLLHRAPRRDGTGKPEPGTRRCMGRMLGLALLCGPVHPASADTGGPWTVSLSAYAYFIEDDDDYVLLMGSADTDRLHLEARYNYEDLDTASVWAGYNLAFGTELAVSVTPMLGVAFGRTNGIAPGYEASAAWHWLDIYTEGEYLIDTNSRDDSFFYSWSELAASPTEWLRAGLVTQRTQVYETERSLQRGPFVELRHRQLAVAGYVLNPDKAYRIWIVSVDGEF